MPVVTIQAGKGVGTPNAVDLMNVYNTTGTLLKSVSDNGAGDANKGKGAISTSVNVNAAFVRSSLNGAKQEWKFKVFDATGKMVRDDKTTMVAFSSSRGTQDPWYLPPGGSVVHVEGKVSKVIADQKAGDFNRTAGNIQVPVISGRSGSFTVRDKAGKTIRVVSFTKLGVAGQTIKVTPGGGGSSTPQPGMIFWAVNQLQAHWKTIAGNADGLTLAELQAANKPGTAFYKAIGAARSKQLAPVIAHWAKNWAAFSGADKKLSKAEVDAKVKAGAPGAAPSPSMVFWGLNQLQAHWAKIVGNADGLTLAELQAANKPGTAFYKAIGAARAKQMGPIIAHWAKNWAAFSGADKKLSKAEVDAKVKAGSAPSPSMVFWGLNQLATNWKTIAGNADGLTLAELQAANKPGTAFYKAIGQARSKQLAPVIAQWAKTWAAFTRGDNKLSKAELDAQIRARTPLVLSFDISGSGIEPGALVSISMPNGQQVGSWTDEAGSPGKNDRRVTFKLTKAQEKIITSGGSFYVTVVNEDTGTRMFSVNGSGKLDGIPGAAFKPEGSLTISPTGAVKIDVKETSRFIATDEFVTPVDQYNQLLTQFENFKKARSDLMSLLSKNLGGNATGSGAFNDNLIENANELIRRFAAYQDYGSKVFTAMNKLSEVNGSWESFLAWSTSVTGGNSADFKKFKELGADLKVVVLADLMNGPSDFATAATQLLTRTEEQLKKIEKNEDTKAAWDKAIMALSVVGSAFGLGFGLRNLAASSPEIGQGMASTLALNYATRNANITEDAAQVVKTVAIKNFMDQPANKTILGRTTNPFNKKPWTNKDVFNYNRVPDSFAFLSQLSDRTSYVFLLTQTTGAFASPATGDSLDDRLETLKKSIDFENKINAAFPGSTAEAKNEDPAIAGFYAKLDSLLGKDAPVYKMGEFTSVAAARARKDKIKSDMIAKHGQAAWDRLGACWRVKEPATDPKTGLPRGPYVLEFVYVGKKPAPRDPKILNSQLDFQKF